ncbi:MAG: anaerobic ribonucleoside-triphosphate reductase activating protein [Bacillota bacterium]
MKIIGHEPSSFIDYPDKICTVYFVGGCNFRCPYCHNSHLVMGQGDTIDEEVIEQFLKKRKRFIDGVCVSGGEPTLYHDLRDFLRKIKSMGLLVKLDTNGTNPQMLESLIADELVDYIAMDLKAPLHKYEAVTKAKVNIDDIKESIRIIRAAGIDYEFRTTVCKELLTKADIVEIADTIKGSRCYTLQNFRDGETVLAGSNQLHPFSTEMLKELEAEIRSHFKLFRIKT